MKHLNRFIYFLLLIISITNGDIFTVHTHSSESVDKETTFNTSEINNVTKLSPEIDDLTDLTDLSPDDIKRLENLSVETSTTKLNEELNNSQGTATIDEKSTETKNNNIVEESISKDNNSNSQESTTKQKDEETDILQETSTQSKNLLLENSSVENKNDFIVNPTGPQTKNNNNEILLETEEKSKAEDITGEEKNIQQEKNSSEINSLLEKNEDINLLPEEPTIIQIDNSSKIEESKLVNSNASELKSSIENDETNNAYPTQPSILVQSDKNSAKVNEPKNGEETNVEKIETHQAKNIPEEEEEKIENKTEDVAQNKLVEENTPEIQKKESIQNETAQGEKEIAIENKIVEVLPEMPQKEEISLKEDIIQNKTTEEETNENKIIELVSEIPQIEVLALEKTEETSKLSENKVEIDVKVNDDVSISTTNSELSNKEKIGQETSTQHDQISIAPFTQTVHIGNENIVENIIDTTTSSNLIVNEGNEAKIDENPTILEETILNSIDESKEESNNKIDRKPSIYKTILGQKKRSKNKESEEKTEKDSYYSYSEDKNQSDSTESVNNNTKEEDDSLVTLTDHKEHGLESQKLINQQSLNNPNESTNNNMNNNNVASNQEQFTTTTSILNDAQKQQQVEYAKYCADFRPIKNLFNQHIEQFYKPVISLLPEDFQLILLDETHIAGLNTAACLLIITILGVALSIWYTYLKRQQNEQYKQTVRLNEKMLIIENNLKKTMFEKQTFEAEYTDLESKYNESNTRLNEKEDKLKQANDLIGQLTQTNNLNQKELERLRSNESKLNKDLNSFKIELAKLKDQQLSESDDFDQRLNTVINENEVKISQLNKKLTDAEVTLEVFSSESVQLKQKIADFEQSTFKLNETLESKEKLVQILQNSLLQLSKKDIEISTELTDEPLVVVNNFDGLMRVAELQMDIKNLEDQLNNERAQLGHKINELNNLEERFNERSALIDKLEGRQKDFEKLNKDQEMQIRLLNELREKDTKQHLRALTDLDSQLKKKSNDADKISHFLEQLRVKQERIQELETQLARIERQSNQERQQNDKQMHENWLQARKIEKELKEAKLEITTLKERCSELEILNKNLNENNNLMRQTLPGKQTIAQNGFTYMSPMYHQQQQQQQQQQLSNSQISNKSTDSPNNNKEDQLDSSNETKQVDQPLQLDTLIENRRTSSSSPSVSSQSGMPPQQQHQQIPPMPPHMYNPYMIRPAGSVPPPYRYPFPMASPYSMQQQQLNDSQISNDASNASSTPNRSMMPQAPYASAYPPHMVPSAYRINPMLFQQQQQYLQQHYQQFQQSKSATSSQQPSPGINTTIPYSQTYPNYLNDSIGMNRETQSNLEEAVNEATNENTPNTSNSNQTNGYDSNFNV